MWNFEHVVMRCQYLIGLDLIGLHSSGINISMDLVGLICVREKVFWWLKLSLLLGSSWFRYFWQMQVTAKNAESQKTDCRNSHGKEWKGDCYLWLPCVRMVLALPLYSWTFLFFCTLHLCWFSFCIFVLSLKGVSKWRREGLLYKASA